MDPRLIDLYNDELLHLRSEANEFAQEYPQRAARLALSKETDAVADPYVERLLEGVAFLAARVRLKLEAQFPEFTQQLLDVLFPGWLAPTPSCCVLALEPEASADLLGGPTIPAKSIVVGRIRSNSEVACEFETSRTISLWPLKIKAVRYLASRAASAAGAESYRRPESSLTVELEVTGDADLSKIRLEELDLYVKAPNPHGSRLMELLAGHCLFVTIGSDTSNRAGARRLDASKVRQLGYADDDVLLPVPLRGHAGFRILKEYAALPEKFRFVSVTGMAEALAGLHGKKLVVTFYFDAMFERLENYLSADSLALHCVPAVNLRSRQFDRVQVMPGQTELRISAGHADPRAREVIQITKLIGGGNGVEREFVPLCEAVGSADARSNSHYTVRRQRRLLTQTEQQRGGVRYAGTETFVMLAEPGTPPYGRDLEYIRGSALFSNRGQAILLREQAVHASYRFEGDVPVDNVECVAGPTMPAAPVVDGYDPWRVLSHLFVNYLSLQDLEGSKSAEAVRSMLSLYADSPNHEIVRQGSGLLEVDARLITRRIPGGGPVAFGRGVEVALRFSDRPFEGGSPFLLASVIEHYLAAHVSINSFIEVAMSIAERSDQVRWPARFGRRPAF